VRRETSGVSGEWSEPMREVREKYKAVAKALTAIRSQPTARS